MLIIKLPRPVLGGEYALDQIHLAIHSCLSVLQLKMQSIISFFTEMTKLTGTQAYLELLFSGPVIYLSYLMKNSEKRLKWSKQLPRDVYSTEVH